MAFVSNDVRQNFLNKCDGLLELSKFDMLVCDALTPETHAAIAIFQAEAKFEVSDRGKFGHRVGRGGDAIRTMMIKLNVYTLNEEEWSYQQLFRLWREAGGGGQAVQFDFTGCGFLRQNAVAFLGGLARLIEYRGGQVSFAWDTLGDAVGANLVRIPMISDIQSEIIGQRSDNCRTLVRDCRTVVGA